MWRDPAARRLAAARAISQAGGEAAFFVGIWGRAAFELDATPAQLALLMAFIGGGGLLGSAVSGVLVDRYGPKRVIVLGELAAAPAALALVLPGDLAGLGLVATLAVTAAMVVHNAVMSFPPVMTRDPDQLGRLNAAVEVASVAGFVIGPAGGAVLATVGDLDLVFVANAATSVVAMWLCLRLPEPLSTPGGSGVQEWRWSEVTAGLRFAYGHPRVRFVLGAGTVVWFSFGVFGALEPLYFRDTLETDPATLGWVNALFGLGMATGSLLLERAPRRFTTTGRVTLLVALSGLGAIAYTATDRVGVVAVAGIGWGATLGVLLPTIRTAIQLETPAPLVGRAMSAVQFHERAGDLLPLTVAPVLATVWSAQAVLLASGLAVVVLALALRPAAVRLDPPPRAIPEPASHALVRR